MSLPSFTPVECALAVALAWGAIGCVGLAESARLRFVCRVLFPLSAFASFLLAVIGVRAMADPVSLLTLPIGLPDLPFHVRADPLSAFFLMLLGVGSMGITAYAAGYFREEVPERLRLLAFQYHVFLAAMAGVLIADDAYSFMVAWETMALSSYFLVTTDHRVESIRSAGFLYLLIAHVGAVSILLCFGIMQGGGGFEAYAFDVLRDTDLDAGWATAAFVLALAGFGAKAGMIPLHAWLPEAHPAAPSPVSALMSGIMLKTAIYGFLRVVFDLIGDPLWQWGMPVAILGGLTALFGILYALQQNDLKRLLAYSSVENIGIVLIAIGLAIVFGGLGHPVVASLALVAALLHCLNHAMYKGLLFLGAGSILHATGLRNLNDMGGLIHRMPRTAFYVLVGVLAISALPPLNGFVSEWMIFQTALQASGLEDGVVRSLVPLLAAMLALAAALTVMCFVKVYGVAFLGQPRTLPPSGTQWHDAGFPERLGMAWLALWCVVLGVFPTFALVFLNHVVTSLTGVGLAPEALASDWLRLVPTHPDQASYSPFVFLLTILAVVGLAFGISRWHFRGRVRRAPAWDCGYPEQTARMQDTADAFGQPIRWIFAPVYRIRRKVPAPDDPSPRFRQSVEDIHWRWLYLPVARLVEAVSSRLGMLQRGRISVYLLYSFVTLIALLVFVR